MAFEPLDDVMKAAQGFLYNRARTEELTGFKNASRDSLKMHLLAHGREDEKGHRWLDFDPPITIEGIQYKAIMAQRKVSPAIDLAATEEFVKAKDEALYDRVFPSVTVREFDEDALYLANQEGVVTEAELDALIDENITWSIVAVKAA